MIADLWFQILCLVVGVVVYFRMKVIYGIRWKFIENSQLSSTHLPHLPRDLKMVFYPKYWDKWTFKKWYDYVDDIVFDESGRV